MADLSKSNVRTLIDAGLRSDSHHMTIKKVTQQFLGFTPKGPQVQEIRDAITAYQEAKAETPRPSLKQVKQERGREWDRVVQISEYGSTGPARVIIECQDPQTKSDGTEICEGRREIATQDLFQVYRCASCQKRSVQIARNAMARRRRAARKTQEAGA